MRGFSLFAVSVAIIGFCLNAFVAWYKRCYEAALNRKLTKQLVENSGPGRRGDGAGLYLVVDPARQPFILSIRAAQAL